MNPWPELRGIPLGARAVLSALHLRAPDTNPLCALTDEDWQQAVHFCDRSQLTLTLRRAARDLMPLAVRERTDRDAAKNRERMARLSADLDAAAQALSNAGIPFLCLKGFPQSIRAALDPADRPQYDIDLFCPPEHVSTAYSLFLRDGYESIRQLESFPTDHLPALIRKTGWEWRGDFFDPEIPPPIELHFRFWDEETERLRAPGMSGFWSRRTNIRVGGLCLAVLHEVDALGYAAMHALRHLLRGSLRPWHVYELALLLDRCSQDRRFWERWVEWHPNTLRRLESVSFELARQWFGCDLNPVAQAAIHRLPRDAAAWLRDCAASPLRAIFRPNKDELWLHMSLLSGGRDRWMVARRRILPSRLPGPVDAVYLPAGRMTVHRRALATARNARFAASRVVHHLRALPGVIAGAIQWAVRKRTWPSRPQA